MDASAAAPEREGRFRAVFATVHDPVRRYVVRRCEPSDVDDVVAETMLVVWRRLDDVPAGAELPWSYAVARRCLANHRRSQARRLELADRVVATTSPPSADMFAGESDQHLTQALSVLHDDDRELLTLWAWEDLAPAQIAAVLGIAPGAARVRLHRARGRLREVLERIGNAEASAGHKPGRSREERR